MIFHIFPYTIYTVLLLSKMKAKRPYYKNAVWRDMPTQRREKLMQYLPKEGYQRILVLFFYIIIAVIALTLFLHYLFIPLLPFLIAALISVILQQPIRFLSSKIRIPRKIIAFILVLICFGILFGLTFWVGSRIFLNAKALSAKCLKTAAWSADC